MSFKILYRRSPTTLAVPDKTISLTIMVFGEDKIFMLWRFLLNLKLFMFEFFFSKEQIMPSYDRGMHSKLGVIFSSCFQT